MIQGQTIAPAGVAASNPAFDVTPANLIDAIVTEEGVILSPSTETMAAIKTK
jgi:methylthioribose-1-phosphate isomerase